MDNMGNEMANELEEAALSAIEARANAATDGPWTPYYRVSPRGAHKKWHIGNHVGLCQITMSDRGDDYSFMAHARTDIPALIATIRSLRAEVERLKTLRGEALNRNAELFDEMLAVQGCDRCDHCEEHRDGR